MLERFASLFQGSDIAHGHSKVTGEGGPNGKKEAQSWTDKCAPTGEDWDNHLSGKITLGLPPINSQSQVKWGAIDVDHYGMELKDLAIRIARSRIPAVLCRSKSGGPHIFVFCQDWVPAGIMIQLLETIASHLGFGTAEIFPKQHKVVNNEEVQDYGNWINLPYFGGDRTLRYGFDNNGEALTTVASFLDFASTRIITREQMESFEISREEGQDLNFPEGPPCLELIWQPDNPQDMRNVAMCNAAVYLKLRDPENWKDQLEEYNRKLNDPLPSNEIEAIKKSYEKKDYRYQCDKDPLCRYCNASLCRKQRYGVGGKGALPVNRSLTKVNTVPPVWYLDVQTSTGDVKRLMMETDDLQNPRLFQKRCMEVLDDVPPLIKKDEWDRILRMLYRQVNYIEVPEEMSPEGQFVELLEEFLETRVSEEINRSFEDLIRGLPYKDADYYYFRLRDLRNFLDQHKFQMLKQHQILAVLKNRLNGQTDFKSIKGKGVNYWYIPHEGNASEDLTVPEVEKETPF